MSCKRGEHAQPRRRYRVNIIHAGSTRQTPPDGRLRQQRLKARAHVRQVMLQQVNAARVAAIRLPPEPRRKRTFRHQVFLLEKPTASESLPCVIIAPGCYGRLPRSNLLMRE